MDIDIDVTPSFDVAKHFSTAVKASLVRDDKLASHPCGAYFQAIPTDPLSGLAAIPYEAAESLGFLKLDFLHINVYRHFKTRAELVELLKTPPPWDLMRSPTVVKQLFQLSKHHDLLQEIKPRSIEELADVLALIRPSKRNLVKMYERDRSAARRHLWHITEDDAYAFKKAHAVAYAMVIVLQLHLISAGIEVTA